MRKMNEYDKHLYLDGDNGLKPYLRMKDNGMPSDGINQIAWLLLNGAGCGYCLQCRTDDCDAHEKGSCTKSIADYIRKLVHDEDAAKPEILQNEKLTVMGRNKSKDTPDKLFTSQDEQRLIELGQTVMAYKLTHTSPGKARSWLEPYDWFEAYDKDGQLICLFTPEYPDGCVSNQCAVNALTEGLPRIET